MSKVIYLHKNDIHCTLTTYLYCHFWMLWAAEQKGRECYINWFEGSGSLQSYQDKEMFSKIPNMFEWWFKQPKIDYAPPRNECEIWTWENWKDPSPIPFMAQPLHVIKDYYKKNLHFNDTVNQRGQALVDKYKIDFANTIGVTWRGTDIYLDGRFRMPIERYYKHIDRLLEETPDLRIACTAEESEILDPLLNRYSQAFLIEEFYQAPFGSLQNPERFSPMTGFQRGLQPALMVWLFSKCAFYIKNRSSAAAVASWLSDGLIINLGHPENLGYENQIDKDQIKEVWHDA